MRHGVSWGDWCGDGISNGSSVVNVCNGGCSIHVLVIVVVIYFLRRWTFRKGDLFVGASVGSLR